jgi:hypothetical protein
MAHAERTVEDAVSGMSEEIKKELEGARYLLGQDLAQEKAWAALAAKSKAITSERAAAISERAEAVAAIAKLVWPQIEAGLDELATRVAYGTVRLMAGIAEQAGE